MPPKSTFKWDDALERKFLLAIIQKEGISVSAKYCDEIVEKLGIETTGNALRQKFDKMKKEIIGSGGGGGGSGENGVSTPVKKTAKANGEETGKKSTGKRKAAAKKAAAEDEDEEIESPTKKVKAEREETPELC